MIRLILVLMLSLTSKEGIMCQVPSNLIGEWNIFEMTTDRFYKNFEKDSVYLFLKEDRENIQTNEVKSAITQTFYFFSKMSLTIEQDNTILMNLPGMTTSKEKFTYNPKLSILSFSTGNKLDTLKLTENGLLNFDMSDEYEKKIISYKHKSN